MGGRPWGGGRRATAGRAHEAGQGNNARSVRSASASGRAGAGEQRAARPRVRLPIAAPRHTAMLRPVSALHEPERTLAPRIIYSPQAIAQLGERLLCKQEVTGSIPVGSIGGKRCKYDGLLAGSGTPTEYSGWAESIRS